MNFDQIISYVYPVLTVIIQVAVCVGIGVLVKYLITLLQSKGIGFTDSEISNIEYTVNRVVRYMNQTIVNNMKEQSADGKLTEDQIYEIQNKALNLITGILSTDAVNALLQRYGENYVDYIKVLIENAVIDEKEDSQYMIPEIILNDSDTSDYTLSDI